MQRCAAPNRIHYRTVDWIALQHRTVGWIALQHQRMMMVEQQVCRSAVDCDAGTDDCAMGSRSTGNGHCKQRAHQHHENHAAARVVVVLADAAVVVSDMSEEIDVSMMVVQTCCCVADAVVVDCTQLLRHQHHIHEFHPAHRILMQMKNVNVTLT